MSRWDRQGLPNPDEAVGFARDHAFQALGAATSQTLEVLLQHASADEATPGSKSPAPGAKSLSSGRLVAKTETGASAGCYFVSLCSDRICARVILHRQQEIFNSLHENERLVHEQFRPVRV